VTVAAWFVVLVLGPVVAVTVHTAVNVRLLRRPEPQPSTVDFPVSVLIPARDEAHRIGPCLASLRAQTGVPALEILVLDDGSTDTTAEVVAAAAGLDPRLRLITGVDPPPGWLGKPYACHQLADAADPDSRVLIFVDADMVLAPTAVAAAIAATGAARGATGAARGATGFDLVSPYPRIAAPGPGQRLAQPLLQWSWLSFLPLRAMECSRRPSLAAAGGQFLAVTRDGYARCGGHAAVRDQVLDDVELARAVKRGGGRISLVDGSALATCHMYDGWPDLVHGYTKSLWAVRGSAGLASILLLWYAAPPVVAIAAVLARAWVVAGLALAAYLMGVAGRVLSGHRTGARIWPDALAHPVSIVLFGWLVVRSRRHRTRSTLTWKGRPVIPSTVESEA
jgi:GT2 family glycosyltransferase